MNRINIVTIKMEKVKSMLVENKQISSPNDVFTIVNKYLDGTDREHLVLLTLDVKNKILSFYYKFLVFLALFPSPTYNVSIN